MIYHRGTFYLRKKILQQCKYLKNEKKKSKITVIEKIKLINSVNLIIKLINNTSTTNIAEKKTIQCKK